MVEPRELSHKEMGINPAWETINHMSPGDTVVIDDEFADSHEMDVEEFGEVLGNLGYPATKLDEEGESKPARKKTDQILYDKVKQGATHYEVNMTDKGYEILRVTEAVQVHVSDQAGNIAYQVASFRHGHDPEYWRSNRDGSPRVPAKTKKITGLSNEKIQEVGLDIVADDFGIEPAELYQQVTNDSSVNIEEQEKERSSSVGGMNTQRRIGHVHMALKGDWKGRLLINREVDDEGEIVRIFVWTMLPGELDEGLKDQFVEENSGELDQIGRELN